MSRQQDRQQQRSRSRRGHRSPPHAPACDAAPSRRPVSGAVARAGAGTGGSQQLVCQGRYHRHLPGEPDGGGVLQADVRRALFGASGRVLRRDSLRPRRRRLRAADHLRELLADDPCGQSNRSVDPGRRTISQTTQHGNVLR